MQILSYHDFLFLQLPLNIDMHNNLHQSTNTSTRSQKILNTFDQHLKYSNSQKQIQTQTSKHRFVYMLFKINIFMRHGKNQVGAFLNRESVINSAQREAQVEIQRS